MRNLLGCRRPDNVQAGPGAGPAAVLPRPPATRAGRLAQRLTAALPGLVRLHPLEPHSAAWLLDFGAGRTAIIVPGVLDDARFDLWLAPDRPGVACVIWPNLRWRVLLNRLGASMAAEVRP